MSTNGNDPASTLIDPTSDYPIIHYRLTKREDFAKAAMQGMLASGLHNVGIDSQRWIAKQSAQMADVLIAALNKIPQP